MTTRFIRETLAIAGLAFQIGAVGFFWRHLPAIIPTHYGFGGTADSYGARSTLLVLPAVAVMLYGTLTAVSLFPRNFNFPVAVTDENRQRLERIGIALLGWLKAELTWVLAYISWATIRVGLGVSGGLGWAFLPVMLTVVLGTVGIGVAQMSRVE
jgi:hypothetical protein